MKRYRVALMIALLSAISCAAQAQTPGGAPAVTLNKVETRVNVTGGIDKGVNSPQGRYLPKFFDQVKGVEETVLVSWSAPAGGLKTGGKLTLDYVTSGTGRKDKMVKDISSSAAGNQTATFTIPRVSGDSSKRLEAWRVRVVVDGRVLAEKKSTSWK